MRSQLVLLSLCQISELNLVGGTLGTSIYIQDLKKHHSTKVLEKRLIENLRAGLP